MSEATELGRWGEEDTAAARSWDFLPGLVGAAEAGAESCMSGEPFPRLLAPDAVGGKTQGRADGVSRQGMVAWVRLAAMGLREEKRVDLRML